MVGQHSGQHIVQNQQSLVGLLLDEHQESDATIHCGKPCDVLGLQHNRLFPGPLNSPPLPQAQGPPKVENPGEVCLMQQAHATKALLGLRQVRVHYQAAVTAKYREAQLDVVHSELRLYTSRGLASGTQATVS